MAAALGSEEYNRIVSHSERVSAAYWYAKDSSTSEGAKMRAMRMKNSTTMHIYASKGFAQHDLADFRNKFAIGLVLKNGQLETESSANPST